MQVNNQKVLITRLMKQHLELKTILAKVVELVNKEEFEAEKIVNGLLEFAKKLEIHLELENNEFYPELIRGMEAKGQETVKTRLFMEEMIEIEREIKSFLEKYKVVELVKQKIQELRVDLPEIVSALQLRIESEEAGVYSYWGLF